MAAPLIPVSETAASKTDNSTEGLLDVTALRELARNALVDSLNSVRGCTFRRSVRAWVSMDGEGLGEWRKDISA